MNEPKKTANETPGEIAYRLQSEKRTAEIAAAIKDMMLPGSVFVLVSATVGEGGHTSYASTAKRTDSVRLLTELLDTWKYQDGLMCEPTVQTATFLRENVNALRGIHPRTLLASMDEAMAACHAAVASGDAKEIVVQAMSCATQGLALLQSFHAYAHSKAKEGFAAGEGGAPA